MALSRKVLVLGALVVLVLVGSRAFGGAGQDDASASTDACTAEDWENTFDRFLEDAEACTNELLAAGGGGGDVVEVIWSWDGTQYTHVSGPMPSLGEAGATSYAAGGSQAATFLVLNEAGDVVVNHQVNVGDAALVEIRYPDLPGAETVVVEQNGGEEHREVYG